VLASATLTFDLNGGIGTRLALRSIGESAMEQKSTNQERGRKRLRSKTKAILDKQPSKAPGQDQNTEAFLGGPAAHHPPQVAKANDETQGVSNRPANEENPFPHGEVERDRNREAEPAEDQPLPQQQGGNRGGV
jgi:hypothetical protein